VISQELLARKLIVVYEDGRRLMTDESDIVTVVAKRKDNRRGKPPQNSKEGLQSGEDQL